MIVTNSVRLISHLQRSPIPWQCPHFFRKKQKIIFEFELVLGEMYLIEKIRKNNYG